MTTWTSKLCHLQSKQAESLCKCLSLEDSLERQVSVTRVTPSMVVRLMEILRHFGVRVNRVRLCHPIFGTTLKIGQSNPRRFHSALVPPAIGGRGKFQFVGSNDEICTHHSNWSVICEDLSGVRVASIHDTKGCRVEMPPPLQTFRCLGLKALAVGDNMAESGATALRDITIWQF